MTDSTRQSGHRLRGISHSLVCDILVFVVNFFLAKTLLRWLQAGVEGFIENDNRSSVLGWLIGGALVSFSLGCRLKR